MKNLKKLISVIIAVIMLVGSFATVSAVDYKDVDSTNSYYKAIQVLSGLGVVKGDDEGNFNPTSDIKRSEMVALVCRAMGEDDIASASASTAFTDVAANHWAAGYIAWGVNRGIINGMGDGTFAPDASVSYQDAVVMIMRALGFDRIAQRAENGGYPTGYLKLAAQYEVLKDAAYDNQAAAPREVIAQLIYNALTAPLVDVYQYGLNVEDDRYIIYNGNAAAGGEIRDLLRYTNEIYQVKAVVVDTPKAAADDSLNTDDGFKVTLDVVDAFDYNTASTQAILGCDGSGEFDVFVGETNAADLLGVSVEAYVAKDEDLNDWILLAVVADAKSTVKATITENFDTIVVDDTTNVISYWKSLDDRKMTEFDVAELNTLNVYYNGKAVTVTDDMFGADAEDSIGEELQAILNAASSITLAYNKTASSVYTSIFVTEYDYAKVKSVNAAENIIKLELGYLDLSEEARDEDFIYNIYDAEGNAIGLEDINEGDILNILTEYGVSYADVACDYVDVYVSNETVTGKVSEQKDGKWIIDGKGYAAVGAVDYGDEGIFFLTIDGKIFDSEAVSVISKNFAFLTGIDEDTSTFETTYALHVYTAEGNQKLDVASKVKVIDATNTATNYYTDNTQTNTQDDIFASGGMFFDAIVNTATEATSAAAIAAIRDEYAVRFFAYKLDANGDISEIRLAGTGDPAKLLMSETASANWNAEFEEFEGESVVDVPLFVAPITVTGSGPYTATLDRNDITIANFSSLKDEADYMANIYTLEDDDAPVAVLLAEETGFAFDGSHIAVVQNIGTALDAEDNEVRSITFVQSGVTETIKVSNDIKAANDVADLANGDIFFYSVDADNEIVKLEKIYNADDRTLPAADTYKIDDDDFAFVYGVITAAGDKITLADTVEVVAGEFKAVDGQSIKLAVNEVEGATYAWVEEATMARKGCKAISITGVKETIRVNQVYAAVAVVNANKKVEDIVVIAYGSDIDTVGEINALGFELNYED